MLEQLRIDMIVAFRVFTEKPVSQRETDWDNYCALREDYLRESAKILHIPYIPLKYLIDKGEGHS